MNHRLKRNTAPATKAAAEAKRQRKLDLQKRIAEKILPDFCKNQDEGCPGAIECGRDIFTECTSYNDLAGTLNTLKVPTLRGTTGNWKAQMVKNLFEGLRENHQ